MNVALNALPSFTALPAPATISPPESILGAELGYLDRAWQTRVHRRIREPWWKCDPLDAGLLARAGGQHFASLFCQHVAPELPDGKSGTHREEVADLMIATVYKFGTGFAASVIGRQVLSARFDLERQFGRSAATSFTAP